MFSPCVTALSKLNQSQNFSHIVEHNLFEQSELWTIRRQFQNCIIHRKAAFENILSSTSFLLLSDGTFKRKQILQAHDHTNLLALLYSLWNSPFFTLDWWTRQTITVKHNQIIDSSIFLKQTQALKLIWTLLSLSQSLDGIIKSIISCCYTRIFQIVSGNQFGFALLSLL